MSPKEILNLENSPIKDADSPVYALASGNNDNQQAISLPTWVQTSAPTWGEALDVLEWEETTSHNNYLEYRNENGWLGTDFCHDRIKSPVYVSHYRANYAMYKYGNTMEEENKEKILHTGVGTTLTGIAHFTPLAESHKGYCHGGSMCALMDDVVGWCGFLTTGKCLPWSGFTAQINTSLKKPIPVNSILKVKATIVKREGRKIYMEAIMEDPSNGGCVHASGTGLFLLKRDSGNVK